MQGESRLPVLDGWRGLSIVLVLAAHLLPLGPTGLDLNAAVAAAGMALFFTLSGFLITGFLLRNDNVDEFLISRLARIVPLAWLFLGWPRPTSTPAGADTRRDRKRQRMTRRADDRRGPSATAATPRARSAARSRASGARTR
jgi:hypothetical protein